MLFYDLKMNLKNKLIRKLISNTRLYASTIYDVVWRYSYKEMMVYVEEVEKARKESGCRTKEEYHKWFEENKYPQLKKQWDEMSEKLEKQRKEDENSLTF